MKPSVAPLKLLLPAKEAAGVAWLAANGVVAPLVVVVAPVAGVAAPVVDVAPVGRVAPAADVPAGAEVAPAAGVAAPLVVVAQAAGVAPVVFAGAMVEVGWADEPQAASKAAAPNA